MTSWGTGTVRYDAAVFGAARDGGLPCKDTGCYSKADRAPQEVDMLSGTHVLDSRAFETCTIFERARVDPARLLPRGQPNTRTETDLIAMFSLAQPVRGGQHLNVRLEPIGDVAKNFRDG